MEVGDQVGGGVEWGQGEGLDAVRCFVKRTCAHHDVLSRLGVHLVLSHTHGNTCTHTATHAQKTP